MSSIVVPQGLEYTVAAFLSIPFVLLWQGTVVSRARKAAGVKYPQAYAEKAQVDASKEALIFNCAQRAHQNTLENIPVILITTAVTAIKYPVPAAAALGVYQLSRIVYTLGYATGEPAKRGRGSFGYLGLIGLILGSGYTAFDLIRAGI